MQSQPVSVSACPPERLCQLDRLSTRLKAQIDALEMVGLSRPASVMAEALAEVQHLINYRDCPAEFLIRGPYPDEFARGVVGLVARDWDVMLDEHQEE